MKRSAEAKATRSTMGAAGSSIGETAQGLLASVATASGSASGGDTASLSGDDATGSRAPAAQDPTEWAPVKGNKKAKNVSPPTSRQITALAPEQCAASTSAAPQAQSPIWNSRQAGWRDRRNAWESAGRFSNNLL